MMMILNGKLVDIVSESWSCGDVACDIISTSSFSIVLNPS